MILEKWPFPKNRLLKPVIASSEQYAFYEMILKMRSVRNKQRACFFPEHRFCKTFSEQAG